MKPIPKNSEENDPFDNFLPLYDDLLTLKPSKSAPGVVLRKKEGRYNNSDAPDSGIVPDSIDLKTNILPPQIRPRSSVVNKNDLGLNQSQQPHYAPAPTKANRSILTLNRPNSAPVMDKDVLPPKYNHTVSLPAHDTEKSEFITNFGVRNTVKSHYSGKKSADILSELKEIKNQYAKLIEILERTQTPENKNLSKKNTNIVYSEDELINLEVIFKIITNRKNLLLQKKINPGNHPVLNSNQIELLMKFYSDFVKKLELLTKDGVKNNIVDLFKAVFKDSYGNELTPLSQSAEDTKTLATAASFVNMIRSLIPKPESVAIVSGVAIAGSTLGVANGATEVALIFLLIGGITAFSAVSLSRFIKLNGGMKNDLTTLETKVLHMSEVEGEDAYIELKERISSPYAFNLCKKIGKVIERDLQKNKDSIALKIAEINSLIKSMQEALETEENSKILLNAQKELRELRNSEKIILALKEKFLPIKVKLTNLHEKKFSSLGIHKTKATAKFDTKLNKIPPNVEGASQFFL